MADHELTTDGDLAAGLRTLLAERAIDACLRRYAHGIDRRDWDLLKSAFHPDALEIHGPFEGNPEDFVAWLRAYSKDRDGDQHFIGSHEITVDGDRAESEAYFIAGRQVGREVSLTGGRYESIFTERPGVGWRISRRVVVVEWACTVDGSRGIDDPTLQLFRRHSHRNRERGSAEGSP